MGKNPYVEKILDRARARERDERGNLVLTEGERYALEYIRGSGGPRDNEQLAQYSADIQQLAISGIKYKWSGRGESATTFRIVDGVKTEVTPEQAQTIDRQKMVEEVQRGERDPRTVDVPYYVEQNGKTYMLSAKGLYDMQQGRLTLPEEKVMTVTQLPGRSGYEMRQNDRAMTDIGTGTMLNLPVAGRAQVIGARPESGPTEEMQSVSLRGPYRNDQLALNVDKTTKNIREVSALSQERYDQGDIVGSFSLGAAAGIYSVANIALHPVKSVKKIVHTVTHPGQTVFGMAVSAADNPAGFAGQVAGSMAATKLVSGALAEGYRYAKEKISPPDIKAESFGEGIDVQRQFDSLMVSKQQKEYLVKVGDINYRVTSKAELTAAPSKTQPIMKLQGRQNILVRSAKTGKTIRDIDFNIEGVSYLDDASSSSIVKLHPAKGKDIISASFSQHADDATTSYSLSYSDGKALGDITESISKNVASAELSKLKLDTPYGDIVISDFKHMENIKFTSEAGVVFSKSSPIVDPYLPGKPINVFEKQSGIFKYDLPDSVKSPTLEVKSSLPDFSLSGQSLKLQTDLPKLQNAIPELQSMHVLHDLPGSESGSMAVPIFRVSAHSKKTRQSASLGSPKLILETPEMILRAPSKLEPATEFGLATAYTSELKVGSDSGLKITGLVTSRSKQDSMLKPDLDMMKADMPDVRQIIDELPGERVIDLPMPGQIVDVDTDTISKTKPVLIHDIAPDFISPPDPGLNPSGFPFFSFEPKEGKKKQRKNPDLVPEGFEMYQPSMLAKAAGIFAEEQPSILTGLEIRPIIRKKRRKKR